MNENWTPKNSTPELSDADAELLSAYIDKMLDAQDLAALEKRLETEAYLRRELAAMQQTVTWLNTLPVLKAPRNFTLNEADVKKASTPKIIPMPRRTNFWQVAGAAAAVFVVVLIGVAVILPRFTPESPVFDVAMGANEAEPQDDAINRQALDTTSPMLASTSMLIAPVGQATMAAAPASSNVAQEASVENEITVFGVVGVDDEQQAEGDFGFAMTATEFPKTSDAPSEENAPLVEMPLEDSNVSHDNDYGGQGGGLESTAARAMPTSEANIAIVPPMPQGTSLPESMEMANAASTVTEEIANLAIMSSPVQDGATTGESADTSLAMASTPSFGERFGAVLRGLLFALESLSQR